MVDPDGWYLSFPAAPFEGQHCFLVQQNQIGQRYAVDLDVARAVVNATRLPDRELFDEHAPDDSTESRLSSKGRWIADIRHTEKPTRDTSGREESTESLTLINTTTGEFRRDFVTATYVDVCFSDDESLIAISEEQEDRSAKTTVWNLDRFQEMQSVKIAHVGYMSFSPTKRWIAIGDYDKIRIWNIRTGELIHDLSPHHMQMHALKFSSDERYLTGYDYLRGGASGPSPDHCMISEVYVWDLEKGEYLGNRVPAHVYFFDPNLCEDGWLDQKTPLIVQDENRLLDVKTGETTFQIPEHTTVEIARQEANLVVLNRPCASQRGRLSQWLRKWNIRILDFLLSSDDERSQLLISKSGRIRFTLPSDHYRISSSALLLSPDAKMLITKSNSSSTFIKIWDLTAPRPWLKILGWSLVVPFCLLVSKVRLNLRPAERTK